VIAYIDSSVLLSIVLDQQPQLEEWHELQGGVSSVLLGVESSRSLDRLWHQGHFDEEELATKRMDAAAILQRIEKIPIGEGVLEIAALPLPTPLRTLDAIHLATAITYRRMQPKDERPILFATHDQQLAKAAAAMHFEVIGASV
jgi:predicted nucleic acid-binding protein